MDNPLLHGHTYEYDLGWMVCRIKQMIADIALLKKRQEDQGIVNDDLNNKLSALKTTVDRLEQMILTGNFPPDYIYQWANNNLPQIIAGIVKYVVFGLSRDGYFVATAKVTCSAIWCSDGSGLFVYQFGSGRQSH